MEGFNIYLINDTFGINVFYFKAFFGFVIAFFITFITIPKIIRVSYVRHLNKKKDQTPNLGGVALFFAITVSASIFAYELFGYYIFLFACLMVLFFIGLMDDMSEVSPNKKIIAQIIVGIMISVGSNCRIGNLCGLFGIYEIPYLLSIIITVLTILLIIRGYNIIDRIDAFAGWYAIMICSIFIAIYYKLNILPIVVLCLTIIGSLLAFLNFNVKRTFKIYMGDTGSLLIGFLLSFLAIQFMNLTMIENASGSKAFYLPSSPAIVTAIFIIPICDITMVGINKLLNLKWKTKYDVRHVHQKHKDSGVKLYKIITILLLVNLFIVFAAYLLRYQNVNLDMLVVLILGFLLIILPTYFLTTKIKK